MQVGLQDYLVEQTSAEWTLYHNDFSLCSRKVRICLHEVGFKYDSKHIDLIETGKYEVASKSFLKINPGATVPVLLNKVGQYTNHMNKLNSYSIIRKT